MLLGERYRCGSLKHLVAKYPCNPQAKIPSLVAKIADFLSPLQNVPKWAAACSEGSWLLLVFTACLAVLACNQTQCTRVDVAGKHVTGDRDVVSRFWGVGPARLILETEN